MYASCMVLCVVLLAVTGDVKSTKYGNYKTVTKTISLYMDTARRKPLEIDKKENQRLNNLLLDQGLDLHTGESTGKQKRSSKPKAISDLKLRIQQRRTEVLCKFCGKSSLRMKRTLCKRCTQIIPSTAKKLATVRPPTSSSRQTARIAGKTFKNSVLPAKKTNTVSFKNKMELLQSKHKANALRSTEGGNNEMNNEKFLLANRHNSKTAIVNRKLVKLNDANVNKTNLQITPENLGHIKHKLFPNKVKTIDNNIDSTVKIKKENKTENSPQRKVTEKSLKKKVLASQSTNIENNSNIIPKTNFNKIDKKLIPSKPNISNKKVGNTQQSNEINKLNKSNLQISNIVTNPNISVKTILRNSKKMDKEPDLNSKEKNSNVSEFHSRLIKFPFLNKQIKRNLDSPWAMQRNSEQDKMYPVPKADRRKLLENSRKNTRNTSEDDEKENVIENNKGTVLTISKSAPLPTTSLDLSNLILQNILPRKINLQKARESETSNLENIRPKRLKAINHTSIGGNLQLENNRTPLHINSQQGKPELNEKIIKFTEPRFIKTKSAFNINLSSFEMPLLESPTKTKHAEEKFQTIVEILPLSPPVKLSQTTSREEKRKSFDELPGKSLTENDESSQSEIPTKKIQNYRRNNVTLLKPDGASSLTGSQGVIENINNGNILRGIQDKSGMVLKENVHFKEGEIMMNNEYSHDVNVVGVAGQDKNIHTARNFASDKNNTLKLNTEKVAVKRSTTRGFMNSATAHSMHDKYNISEISDISESIDQTTPQDSDIQLQSQHFLNRKVYLKHPRITSTYDDGKHKYVLKMAPRPPYYTNHKWDDEGMPIWTTTTVVPTTNLHTSTTNIPVSEEHTESSFKTKVTTNKNSDLRNAEKEENFKTALTESLTNINAHQDSRDTETLNNHEQNILGLKKSIINTSNIGKESEHTDVIKHLTSQTFLNRNVYLKHPRFKSIIGENGKHKYVPKNPTRPPYNSKYNLNSLGMQRNIVTITEHPDSRNTITEVYSDTTKSIRNTTPNTNSQYRKPNTQDDNAKNSQIEKQNKSDTVSQNLEQTNLNESNKESNKQFENSATTQSVFHDTNQTSESFNVNTHLRTQHFLNRKVYLKHPRIASVYENGQHKYVLKAPPRPPYQTKHKWDILGMPLTTSTTMNPTTVTINFDQKVTLDNHDSVSSKSNKLNDTKKNNFDQDDPLMSLTENSEFEVSKEINSDDEAKNKEQDIFRRHLNMHPEINKEKYKNIIYGKGKELRGTRINSQETNINIPRDIILPSTEQEFLNNNARQNNEPENQDFKDENSLQYFPNLDNLSKMKSQISADPGKRSIPISLGNIPSDQIHVSDNKINLPLVLKQTENGNFQLVLDTSRMCNYSKCGINNYYVNNQQDNLNKIKETQLPYPGEKEEPKPISKRKIEENLNKNSLHIFNILGQSNHLSSTQINNFLQGTEENESKFGLKEQYIRLLIENRLLALFHSLNIPVKNTQEIDNYINDLPNEEKQEFENYLLYSLTKNFDEDAELSDIMRDFSNSENSPNQLKLKPTPTYDISESTTEGNYRIQLKMSDESDDIEPDSSSQDMDIKTLIREEIKKELQKINKNYDNNKIQFLSNDSSEYYNEKKVVNKRHQHFFDEDASDSSNEVNPHGIRNRKYKIVNNLLNWARDCIVKH